ncbi:MAG: beta-ketoacyl-ACP synthase II [candidate division KSB1 bacterium]|nr:beta-ketoacyl-ACP synthase II [candidate division KSB1 bacterium]MDZ7393653.1 beta-ketoacyl-ACP synthase II [candidate division KSB1 bacterium]MDZ7412730.1 beta-ketoacyl-ACP synthase II [candidate division KSB1 bacterium]
MEKRRVVVTGMGVITPLGSTLEQYWQGLVTGTSGVDYVTYFDTSEFDTKFAAWVKDFDPEAYIDRKEARRMDRFTQFAVACSDLALKDAGLNLDNEDKTRIGVVLASGVGGMDTFEREYKVLFDKGPQRISPFFIPMMIADIAPGYVSIRHGLKGPNYSTVSACASSSHAIGDAFRLIAYGDADVMVTGGSEASCTRMGFAGFNAMRALSTRNDNPKAASRPFDLHRDGFVMGEGAAVVILEELGHALKRGARIYAEVVGVGFTADAYHITAPDPDGDGAARAMRLAMAEARVQPEDVDYINAHGTSTPHNDRVETMAIKKALGDHAYKVAISSSKSMIGHLLGASGAAEFVATVLTIVHQTIHPTINLEVPDPECDLDYTPQRARPREVNLALSNSFGFGGHNVCLAVRRYR